MTIPAKYQLFHEPVVLTDKDTERLNAYRGHWMTLHPVVMTANEPDLKRLIVLELMTDRRMDIADRIIARLAKLQRQSLTERVQRAMK